MGSSGGWPPEFSKDNNKAFTWLYLDLEEETFRLPREKKIRKDVESPTRETVLVA